MNKTTGENFILLNISIGGVHMPLIWSQNI